MSIRDTLKDIVDNVEGALAAMIMAYDGIPVDEITVPQSGFDLQSLSVEYATVLKEIKRAAELVKAGAMEEVSITTNQTRVALRVLNEDLFTVLIMTRDGNFGKGRYLLRLKGYDLARELA
ncbi:roadblock/LC7 domain-containing protein [Oryzomonas japonica]|uniref:Roadblock/LC7 domain-containing protein n=1 Tax=Oryzomonas japonica TaxID=2603858 RepID=A0A7J4ZT08_9BACT|nr:roadblock/LC7 domain-containing protein [Oryzomonas japonica]KAB0666474.1 roadblock/LC7 domain-containing protein [Oryzomonas japonica]